MRIRPTLVLLYALCTAGSALAQQSASPLPTVNTPVPVDAKLGPADLNRLLAPVALYPDTLLAGILAAATYPTEVVEAQRFLADPANAGLSVAELTEAAADHGWDASVAGLLVYPGVLRMMDANLEWTDRLGRAFVAQQADVMGAVQALREMAQQAGALTNGPYDTVVNDGGDILISAPSPQEGVVPSYDPACVYGQASGCGAAQDQVGWADGFALPYGYLGFGLVDWPHRLIRTARSGGTSGAVWRHVAGRGVTRSPVGAGFAYAPPANVLYGARGSRGGLVVPVRGGVPAAALRAPVVHLGAARVVGGVHAVGVGRH